MKKYIKYKEDKFVNGGFIGNMQFCHYSRELRKIKDYVISNYDCYETCELTGKKRIVFQKGCKYKINYRFKIMSISENGFIKTEEQYILIKTENGKEKLMKEKEFANRDSRSLTYGNHLLTERI